MCRHVEYLWKISLENTKCNACYVEWSGHKCKLPPNHQIVSGYSKNHQSFYPTYNILKFISCHKSKESIFIAVGIFDVFWSSWRTVFS